MPEAVVIADHTTGSRRSSRQSTDDREPLAPAAGPPEPVDA
jgi:hypothetical protein